MGTDRTVQQVLEAALELHRRRVLLEQASAAYARLKGDHERYENWQSEQAQWEVTLFDGLDRL